MKKQLHYISTCVRYSAELRVCICSARAEGQIKRTGKKKDHLSRERRLPERKKMYIIYIDKLQKYYLICDSIQIS